VLEADTSLVQRLQAPMESTDYAVLASINWAGQESA
jgi:hypothetical protein